MLISIIVPVYNVEKYLARCLNSILNQTYKNLEIVLINDGSTDYSRKICQKYASQDSRIVFIDQINKGVSATRNLGLRVAKGDYIGFIDSDDLIDPEMYEEVMNTALKFDLQIVATNYYAYERGNLNYQIIRNDLPHNIVLGTEQVKEYFLQSYYGSFLGIVPSICTKIYKTSLLRENNICFNEKLKRAEDFWFNFDVFLIASKVFVIDKPYYHYFKNDGSAMQRFRENDFKDFIENRTKLLSFNSKLGFIIDYCAFDKGFIIDCNEYVLRAIKTKRKDLALIVLNNKHFQEAYKNFEPDRKHTKAIKLFLRFGLTKLAYAIYFIWSLKI
jgi:glycosyltransferase involved in cell wall biosynthesis